MLQFEVSYFFIMWSPVRVKLTLNHLRWFTGVKIPHGSLTSVKVYITGDLFKINCYLYIVIKKDNVSPLLQEYNSILL